MPAQETPGPCAACGELLQHPVRFCPFCGISRIATVASAPLQPPPVETPPRASAPQPIVPRVLPAPRPQPTPPVRWNEPPPRPPVSAPPPPRPPIDPARRRAHAAAFRKLLLALIILGAAAILWHHLTSGPRATITVRLATPVDGTILVDGIGDGAPDRAITVEPGRHVIGLDATGWTAPPIVVRLRDHEARTVTLSPAARPAALALDSVPVGARVSVGPRRLGIAPASIALPAGAYRVTAALPGYQPLEQDITLAPGEHRSLTLALQPEPVRTLHLVAPAGHWSETVSLAAGNRFTLRFQGRIRLRTGGRVLLLEGGAPVDLGVLDGRDLAFTAVDDVDQPFDLLVHETGSP